MLLSALLGSRRRIEVRTALGRGGRFPAYLVDDAIGREAGAGFRFGQYLTVEQIGSGGMAAVYGAVHVTTREAAAIKVLPAAWGAAPELRARLAREAEVLQRIDHPNVIKVLEVGAVDPYLGGGCYLAMEWLPSALDRVLRARPGPLAVAAALHLARKIADGLAAVHSVGLVHRDVKPSNILLRADGWPILSDFGLATAFDGAAQEDQLTPSNVVLGTADYVAPEQVDGSQVDGRTDVYSLGVVLYEMLAGRVPFAGRRPLDVMRAHVEEPLPQLPPTVPRAAAVVVERALQKSPEDRFPSAAAMAQALEATLVNATAY